MAEGGSGYVLNRFALQLLVKTARSTCMQSVKPSAEDQFMGKFASTWHLSLSNLGSTRAD